MNERQLATYVLRLLSLRLLIKSLQLTHTLSLAMSVAWKMTWNVPGVFCLVGGFVSMAWDLLG